jgi:hypothetical protein
VFPPDPFLRSQSREFFGKKAYEIFSELDELMAKNNIDMLAKHWVIFAGKDLQSDDIRIPHSVHPTIDIETVKGPYDVEFLKYDGPVTVARNSEFRARIQFHNRSYRPFSSFAGENPDFLSYHWLNRQGVMMQSDGIRTPLVKIVMPDEKNKAEMKIVSPEKPGKYILAIDFVQEGKTWFSAAGNPCLQIRMAIKKK